MAVVRLRLLSLPQGAQAQAGSAPAFGGAATRAATHGAREGLHSARPEYRVSECDFLHFVVSRSLSPL